MKFLEKFFVKKIIRWEGGEGKGSVLWFFLFGNNKIELLEATNPDSAIAKFIEKRGEGLHHIAFDVTDIHEEIKRLKREGFVFARDEPFIGADNKLVCFLHPKSTNGI